MTFEPGDVVVVSLGETVGHEQKGKRPAIVASHILFGTVVKVEKGEGGLNENSFALCHQLRAISTERIRDKLGSVNQDTLYKIRTVLANIFEWG